MGRSLTNTMINLGIRSLCEKSLYKMGLRMEELEEVEVSRCLGNGTRRGRRVTRAKEGKGSGMGQEINTEVGRWRKAFAC